ncbi:hypothetical protein Pelo_19792 [Pelomyxa schiedti]|nr:hypothetical protein Pelo_19792 [Pelomyxa schiedti]
MMGTRHRPCGLLLGATREPPCGCEADNVLLATEGAANNCGTVPHSYNLCILPSFHLSILIPVKKGKQGTGAIAQNRM